MKLLCVIPSYWPAFKFGGPIYSVHNLNKALVKKGIDITVYTTNVGLGEKVFVNKEVDVDGVKVIYFGFTKFFEFMGTTGWQFSLPLTKALKNNTKKFDLVYIVSIWNYPTLITAHYCRKYKIPYIISPRGQLYPYATGKKSFKKLPYYYCVSKKDLCGAQAIHYTTEDEMENCHSILGLKNKAFVIPNGIDLSEFDLLPPKERLRELLIYLKNKKILLFLSRINWIKGLDILIKAYAKLVKERKDIHLLIVGNDEAGYIKKVQSWLKEYNLPYNDLSATNFSTSLRYPIPCILHQEVKVTFTGMLTGNAKLQAFAGSDIFVLPSYSENFGMSVVEAMACGLPVVISDKVGIYSEIEKNEAGFIIKTDSESLYKGIKTLLDNEDLRKKIAGNGKRLVENYYDIDKVTEEMIKIYETIVKRERVRREVQ